MKSDKTLSKKKQIFHITLTDGATNCPHPEYKSYETRLSSFSGWPRNLLQTPVQLAEAGFYYTGNIMQETPSYVNIFVYQVQCNHNVIFACS